MLMNPVKSKSIGVSPRTKKSSQITTVMENKLTALTQLLRLSRLKPLLDSPISLMISRRTSMPRIIESLLERGSADNTSGHSMLKAVRSNLVFHLKVSRAQKKCFTQWEELLSPMIQAPPLCIEKPTATTPQGSKNRENTTGNSIQQTTDSVMAKNVFWMERLLLSTPRDTRSNIQKPWSFKKLLRIIKLWRLTS